MWYALRINTGCDCCSSTPIAAYANRDDIPQHILNDPDIDIEHDGWDDE